MILDKIAADTRIRVKQEKMLISEEVAREKAFQKKEDKATLFDKQIAKEGISFICEVKKASPSKGVIVEEFPYLEIGKEYEKIGADVISVLTEPNFFQGHNKYLKEIADEVSIPVLRKDFILEPYQIYQAKLLGASAVLLICSLLDTNTLKNYIQLCKELRLSALVETHNETEMESALNAGASIIGVNNRNLKTFEVDIHTSIRLRNLAPKEILFIAESGIQTREDIEMLNEAQVNGVLIGETLMKSRDKEKMLRMLKGIAL